MDKHELLVILKLENKRRQCPTFTARSKHFRFFSLSLGSLIIGNIRFQVASLLGTARCTLSYGEKKIEIVGFRLCGNQTLMQYRKKLLN